MSDRLEFALQQLKPEHGFLFERFANAFLSEEFPELIPVGGMHDGGRDAFISSPSDEPTVFIQSSLQKTWEAKINATLNALDQNSHTCTMLVYCTNLSIQAEADAIKKRCRKRGVSLQIRDRAYFTTLDETKRGRKSASESLCEQIVDPITRSRRLGDSTNLKLTDEEERVALAYLQLEFASKDSEKSLLKFAIESFVLGVLFKASEPLTLESIISSVEEHFPGGAGQALSDRVKGSLKRLEKHNRLRPETDDGFMLTNKERSAVADKLDASGTRRSIVLNDISDRVSLVAEKLEVDFEFVKEDVANDALQLIEVVLFEKGREAATAISSNQFFQMDHLSLTDLASDCIMNKRLTFSSFTDLGMDRFLDLIPATAADILAGAPDRVSQYLTLVVDAYCLLFVAKQTPDVQAAINKIVVGNRLLLDASVIVACMAERAMPDDRRSLTRLLNAATDLGAELMVHEDAISEVHAHIRMIRSRFRDEGVAVPGSEGEIIEAFKQAETDLGTFDDFLQQFEGTVFSRRKT